jgi:hypothetical protein
VLPELAWKEVGGAFGSVFASLIAPSGRLTAYWYKEALMFKILLLQGANANYLGKREPAWPCSSPRCRAPWPRDRRPALADRRGPAHGSDVVPKNSVSMVKLAQTLARPVRTLDRDAHRL